RVVDLARAVDDEDGAGDGGGLGGGRQHPDERDDGQEDRGHDQGADDEALGQRRGGELAPGDAEDLAEAETLSCHESPPASRSAARSWARSSAEARPSVTIWMKMSSRPGR